VAEPSYAPPPQGKSRWEPPLPCDTRRCEQPFPTETAGLANASRPEIVRLDDGDRFDLRITPLRKRINDAAVRMLGYNGSIPGQRHLLDHAALGAATSQPSSLPQLWIRVKVVPHLPGSANSASASRRSDASSSSLSLSSRRDSSATLN
jgi:hypothetical protein